MVAFEIFGRPIYRYGIFYLITFVAGYLFLWRVARQKFLDSYPKLQSLLQEKLDDLMLVILLGVMVGGRLGHVLFYELHYYLQHPVEIIQVWKGGMAFVGGVLGVTIGLLWWRWYHRLSWKSFLLLGDLVLCVVPLGSLLGRLGNSLNQELWGRPVAELSYIWQETFIHTGLTRVYSQVDELLRVDTNLLQSALEGGILLIVTRSILLFVYRKKGAQPGLIVGWYLIGYAIVRFFAEYFKALPDYEMRGVLSISQWLMLVFFVVGVVVLRKIRASQDR